MARYDCKMCGFSDRRAPGQSEPTETQMARIGSISAPCIDRGNVPEALYMDPHSFSPPRTQYAIRHANHGSYGLPTSPNDAAFSPRIMGQMDQPQRFSPYETQGAFSHGQIPSPQSYYKLSPPLTNGESVKSTKGSFDMTNSPPLDSGFAAFPGTMTSNNEHARTSNKTKSSRKATKQKPTLASRCKMIVKEMFTHHPVDESQLERIETTHWAED